MKYAESLETMAFPDTPLITKVLKRHLCEYWSDFSNRWLLMLCFPFLFLRYAFHPYPYKADVYRLSLDFNQVKPG